MGTYTHLCQYCDKTFSTDLLLANHLQFHTTKNKLFCDMCDKTFSSKGTLSMHKRKHKQTHVTSTGITCSLCNKSFSTNSSLDRHMKSHKLDQKKHLITEHQDKHKLEPDPTSNQIINTSQSHNLFH